LITRDPAVSQQPISANPETDLVIPIFLCVIGEMPIWIHYFLPEFSVSGRNVFGPNKIHHFSQKRREK